MSVPSNPSSPLTPSNPSNSSSPLIREPSAFLPLVMSLTALALVLGNVAIYGIVHDTDEGASAHIWQLLMVLQVPLVAFFAIKWLPRDPGQTWRVLAQQAGAALASMAAVFFLT